MLIEEVCESCHTVNDFLHAGPTQENMPLRATHFAELLHANAWESGARTGWK